MRKSKKKKVVKAKATKRGRPNKTAAVTAFDAGLPALLQPTEHDMMDELSRLDSFTYERTDYNDYI